MRASIEEEEEEDDDDEEGGKGAAASPVAEDCDRQRARYALSISARSIDDRSLRAVVHAAGPGDNGEPRNKVKEREEGRGGEMEVDGGTEEGKDITNDRAEMT